ncbi:receptor-like protein 6 [Cynara cardunculus var. scolymus]|uniref:receptor-like protein 6 n=1 Tax=Cynara cardunculus var. scolymus TaxID=59895 RepID=UPI000D624D1D|nr:receptor-like protein 6 [Cynara cardunculus var. scolymus]
MSSSILLLSFLLLFISLAASTSNHTHRCSSTQSRALFSFKQTVFSITDLYNYNDGECRAWLGSRYYPIMMNWSTSIDCCDWDGVICNHFTGDVIALDLSCAMLRGTIHPNSTLFNLPRLQRLNLAFNDFTDSQLPREIGRFVDSLTHLNISQCGFTGQVPSDISLLRKLVSLDLSSNGVSLQLKPRVLNNLLRNSTLLRDLSLADVNIGLVLPTYLDIPPSLKLLNLSFTGLQGKLPDNIFNLRYLEKLDLSYNNDLDSRLPEVNTSTSVALEWLSLSSTNLSGEIPYSIGHLKYLNYLDLSLNKGLSGEIPYSIGHLESLNTLRLDYCGLAGSLPKSIVNLRHLTTLDLSSNMLNGSLPSGFFALRSLKLLSLTQNQFVGKIDVLDQDSSSQSFRQLVNLTHLDLSFNSFRGVWELDALLSSLTTLVELRLSQSGLSVVTNNANRYVNPDFQFLHLASCKLKVFPESLRAMKKLQSLDLSSNEIHGHIPDWATEIGGKGMFHLDLSHNFITGLPRFQWDGLTELHLESNRIEGPFPPSICNLSNIWYLNISDNLFGGVIPQCIQNIHSSLWIADLGNNLFHGSIPNAYKDCGQLQGLILNGNHLEGEVPSSLSNCQYLEVLNLGNNLLNGTFPSWLGDLPFLQVLVLKSNKLHGPIKTSSAGKAPFPCLQVLDLSNNGFVGDLPRQYFQNFNAMKNVVKNGTRSTYLNTGGMYYSIVVAVKGVEQNFPKIYVDYTIIDLSSNKFESKIPDIIGNLSSLIVLNLSHNSLTGRIPNALGNLSEIESLDLSRNQLTGEIPQSLAALTFLGFLNLSQNRLMGRIPEGKQFNTFEGNSFGGNPQLCGLPLPEKCERPHEPQLETDGDTESEFTWRAVMLGCGCGTILGLVMGYVMLC